MCKCCEEMARFYRSIEYQNKQAVKKVGDKMTNSSLKGNIDALLFERKWTTNHRMPRALEKVVKFQKEGTIGYELNYCPSCGRKL